MSGACAPREADMIGRFAQLLVVLVTLCGAFAHAQWLNHPSPGIPRTADGKPALSAPTPRSADGAIDLSGIWMRVATTRPELGVPGVSDYARYLIEGSAIDMLPATAETYRKIVAVDGLGHPSETCLPKTFPNQILLPVPIQIVQTPRHHFHPVRRVQSLSPNPDRRPQPSS